MDSDVALRRVAEAEALDLVARVLHLRMEGFKRASTIARKLNEQAEPGQEVTEEEVAACLKSREYWDQYFIALEDPDGYAQRRMRDVRAVHRSLNRVEHLGSAANKDKRTQMQAAALRLGLAGYTPQTQVSVGPNEEFVDIVRKLLTPRQPKAVTDGG